MIECKSVKKAFGQPPQAVLQGIDLAIGKGEFIAISGETGSGKSTLLYLLSTLEEPTEGSVWIEGRDVRHWSQEEVRDFRNRRMGFLFQFPHLSPDFTIMENVLQPARGLGLQEEYRAHAWELLDALRLADQVAKYPGQVSPSDRQRAAMARALVLRPQYVFADDPTSGLDPFTGGLVLNILRRLNREEGVTLCLASKGASAVADRVLHLHEGRLSQEKAT